jgi:putative GTP pyrophosphokinase
MNTNEILKEYDKKQDLYGEFTATIEKLLLDLLNRYQIRVLSVTSRIKTRESLENKINIESRKYLNLDKVTDICGLRIITYYPDEIDSVCSLITNEFYIDLKNSVDKRALLDPDRFGYLSVHYIVKLNNDRLHLTEYRKFADFKAEIQVRSILQHAWAEIEHDLGYKKKNAIPAPIRRRFSRLAGLLELADNEFVHIRNELSDYTNSMTQMILAKLK